MKELTQHTKKEEKTELHAKKQKEVTYELLGIIQPRKGQALFEVNATTKEIKKATFKSNTFTVGGTNKKELVINPGCVYIPALNATNAKRRFERNPDQKAYYVVAAPFSDINPLSLKN